MSQRVCARVVLGIVIVLSAMFLFLYYIFESFGIGEYVWPILWPILIGIGGLMIVIFGVSFTLCTVNQGASSDRRTYAKPLYRPGDYAEGSVYTIPVYCPHCKYRIEMNHVEWVGSSELTCANCFRVVQVGIREHL